MSQRYTATPNCHPVFCVVDLWRCVVWLRLHKLLGSDGLADDPKTNAQVAVEMQRCRGISHAPTCMGNDDELQSLNLRKMLFAFENEQDSRKTITALSGLL